MPAPSPSPAEKRRTFRKLHESGCFLLPNPWNVGTALYLQQLGFKALATTSSGFAFSRGRSDGAVSLDEVLAHCREIADATDLPLNADFEDGHGKDEKEVAENVRHCIDTGVAGISIEDSTGDRAKPLYEVAEAVARLQAARAAIDAAGGDVVLVGRAECYLVRHPEPLKESIKRLVAYSEAGADCLYAPGLRTFEEITAVVKAVAPKPVNVLIGWPTDFTLADLAGLGVRRVSVGGALSAATWGAFARVSKQLLEGRFDGFAENMPNAELNKFFHERQPRKRP